MILALLTAFAGGIICFFSPCILPVIPGYISLLSGFSATHAKMEHDAKTIALKTGVNAVFFCLGFSCIFILLGASASVLGKFLDAYAFHISVAAGIVLILLGVFMLDIIKLPALQYEKRFAMHHIKVHGHLGAFLMGLAFSLGWSPCIGPMLTGFLILAAAQETALRGMVLLASYSLGLAIPFLIVGFTAGHVMGILKKHRKVVVYSKIISGVILILIGFVLIFRSNLLILRNIIPV